MKQPHKTSNKNQTSATTVRVTFDPKTRESLKRIAARLGITQQRLIRVALLQKLPQMEAGRLVNPPKSDRENIRPALYPDRVKLILDGWTESLNFPSLAGEDPFESIFQKDDFRIITDSSIDGSLFADFAVKTRTGNFCKNGGSYVIERKCIPVTAEQALNLILAATIPDSLMDLLLERLAPRARAAVKSLKDGADNFYSPMFQ